MSIFLASVTKIATLWTNTNYKWLKNIGIMNKHLSKVSLLLTLIIAFFLSNSLTAQVDAGGDQTTCTNSATLNAIPPGGVWSTSGGAIIATPSSQSTIVTGLDAGANTFTYTIGGPQSDDVVVTNNQIIANAGADVTNSCATTITLNGNDIPGASGQWTLPDNTPGVIIDNTAQYNTQVHNLPFGTTLFNWTVSANGCSDFDQVSIYNGSPDNNLGGDQAACTNTFYIGAATPPMGGEGQWSFISGAGATFDDPTSAGVEIIASIGSSTVRWTIWNDMAHTCSSSKDFILTNNLPSPSAGTDISTCNDDITLAAAPLLGGETGIWSVIDPQGEIFSDASIHDPNVSNVKQGTTTFEWTVSNAFCSASDFMQVLNNRPDVDAGPDDVICTGDYTLNANNPTPFSGSWTCDKSVTFNNPNLYNATASGMENDVYTFTWTVDNGTCIASDDIVISSDFVTIMAGADQNECSSSFSLSATAIPTGGSGYWTRTFGDGTIDNSLSPTATANNISTISNFRWTIISGACNFTDDIQLENQLPSQAATNADKAVCDNETMITASPPVDQNEAGIWSIEGAGTASIAVPSLFQTQVTNLQSGLNTFRWTIYNQNCSTYDLIEVTNNEITTNAGTDQIVCTTIATLNATLVGGSGYWTTSSPTAIIANSTSPISNVSTLSFGTNNFTWTRNDLGCTASDEVIITSDLPVNVFAGFDQVICEDQTFLAADNPSHGTGSWSVISGGGTFADDADYQTNVTGVNLGANTYRWTVDYNLCSSYDEVLVSNQRIVITAGETDTICNQTFANLNGTEPTVGQNGLWTVTGGNGDFANASLFNTSVDNLIKGVNTFRWTISDGTCSNSAEVTIHNDTPDPADVSSDITICSDNTAISAVAVSNGVGSWSVSSGTGIFDNSNNNNTTVSSIGSGANTYTWTVTKNKCYLSADIIVSNNSVNAVISSADGSICDASHSTTITAIDPTEPGASGIWTKISTGSGTIQSPSNFETIISVLANGENRFRWTVQNADCSSYDEITITNDYYTATASPVGSAAICADYIGIIGNSAPPSGIGIWTANQGMVTFDDLNSGNTYARNLPLGTTNLTWTITNNGCSAPTNFDVNNNSLTVSAGADLAGCNAVQMLDADALSGGQSGYWVANNIAVTFDNSSDPLTTARNIPMGTSQLTWTITENGCFANDDMILTNNAFFVTAGANQTLCGTDYTLSGSDPLATGTGSWSVIQGGGDFASPNSHITDVSNLPNGDNIFRWTVNRNSCQATADVTITNDLYIAEATAPTSVCIDEVDVDAQALPGGSGATGIWTTLHGGGIFDNSNDNATTVRGLSLGSNRFRWTVTKGSCESYINVEVMDHRVVVSAGTDKSICEDYTDLFASSLGTGETGLWTCNIPTVVISSPANSYTNVSNLDRGPNIFTWTVNSNGCNGFNTVTVTNNEFDADAGIDQEIIVPNTTMAASLPGGATGTWSIVTGNVTFNVVTSPNTSVSNVGFGANTYRWTVNSNGCFADDEVVITYNVAESYAGVDQVSCDDFASLDADQPLMGTGVWSIVQGSCTFDDPLKYNALVTNVARGINIFRWTVTAFGSIATDDVTIMNNSFDIYAGEDQQTCNTTVQMNAQDAGTGVGYWTILAGSGTFSGNYDNNATVSNMFEGDNLYIWKVDRNSCSTTDTVRITHYTPVNEANAGADVQLCDENEYTLAANPAAGGVGVWTSDNTDVTIDIPGNYSTVVHNLPEGPTTFWWTISNQHCQSQDEIIISSWNTVEITNYPSSLELNVGMDAIFTVETTGSVELFQWQKDEANLINGGRISGANDASLTISNVNINDDGYYKCIVQGYCNELETDVTPLSIISGFEALEENGIKLYPNPSDGIVNFEYEDVSKVDFLSIYNLSGKKIAEKQNLNKMETFDLSSNSDGTYIVLIKLGNKLMQSKLIIKK